MSYNFWVFIWKFKFISIWTVSLFISCSILSFNLKFQFKERIKSSHDAFVTSMKQLEMQLTNRLEHTEEQQTRIKKIDAPKLARMSLESTSLKDMILFGT